jgi:hypothetical protein
MAGKTEETGMDVHAPRWKWEWGPNTVFILAGFASGFVAWGYTLSDLVSAKAAAANGIAELRREVKRIDESNSRYSNLEWRVTETEAKARAAEIVSGKTTEAISELASDVRSAREILERLEKRSPL